MSQKPADKTRTRGRAPSLPNSPAHPPGEQGTSTPTKPTGSRDGLAGTKIADTLKHILSRLDDLDAHNTTKSDTDTLHQNELKENMLRIDKFMVESRESWDSCKRRLAVSEHELSLANERNRRLQVQVNNLENRMRICNIRIEGKSEDRNENLQKFVIDLAKEIGVNNLNQNEIASASRLGKLQPNPTGTRNPKPRTIMITFHNMQSRNRLYYARANLRNVDRCHGIYINDDVSPLTRKQRDEYRSVAALARADGAEIRVHDDGLVINGHKYLLSEPHTLPDKYSISKARTVESEGELYFSSEHSFLSNFAPSPILDGGVVYASGEHMYQARKCEQAQEFGKLRKVISAPTALEAKRVADTITETPEWRGCRDAVMTEVIDEKFKQNPDLAKMLVATGDIQLNEATRNDHFGIGVTIHSREIKDKSYRGGNKLGEILMNKRTNLKVAS